MYDRIGVVLGGCNKMKGFIICGNQMPNIKILIRSENMNDCIICRPIG